MFSATVSESNNAPDWKTMVTFRRMRRSWASSQSVMSSCATITRPRSGFRKPMMCARVTDFPTPLRPMIATVSPELTWKLTSSKTGLSNVL
jgi:hypothetical protein